jgi:hypothetical protein
VGAWIVGIAAYSTAVPWAPADPIVTSTFRDEVTASIVVYVDYATDIADGDFIAVSQWHSDNDTIADNLTRVKPTSPTTASIVIWGGAPPGRYRVWNVSATRAGQLVSCALEIELADAEDPDRDMTDAEWLASCSPR